MIKQYYFEEVALLITHYNRSYSIQILLQAFKDQKCAFGEIIVSDDGSKPEHQTVLKELQSIYEFKLISSPNNKGLGNNINKGQDAVTKPFTLYIQEDFIPKPGFVQHLKDAFQFIKYKNQFDIIRFYAYFTYPDLVPYEKGFSKMTSGSTALNNLKYYGYSNHPHLRKSLFLNKFGRYAEDVKDSLAEYQMAVSFLKNQGTGLFYKDFTVLFDQQNPVLSEPYMIDQSSWLQNKSALTLIFRTFYLKFKYVKSYVDLWFAEM